MVQRPAFGLVMPPGALGFPARERNGAHDAGQPRSKRAAVQGRTGQDLDPRLLDDLLGLVVVANETARQPPDVATVLEELLGLGGRAVVDQGWEEAVRRFRRGEGPRSASCVGQPTASETPRVRESAEKSDPAAPTRPGGPFVAALRREPTRWHWTRTGRRRTLSPLSAPRAPFESHHAQPRHLRP